jgi:hypothetical protein
MVMYRKQEINMQSSSQFIYVLALCIVCGLSFAGMATWLMTRRGNTIKDILQSSQFKDAKALSLEVTDKVKVSTNIPIVAMYIVAALVAVGLPIFISYQQSRTVGDAPVLRGQIKDYRQVVALDKGEKVYASPVEMIVLGDGSFSIPLRTTEGGQVIQFESPSANPLTLTLDVQPREGNIKVSSGSFGEQQVIPLTGKFASLTKPLLMSRVSAITGAIMATEMQPTVIAKISPEFASLDSAPTQ